MPSIAAVCSSVLLVAGGAFLSACGGVSEDDDGPTDSGTGGTVSVPTTGPIMLEAMPTAVGTELCAAVERCGCDWQSTSLCEENRICPASREECIEQVSDVYRRAHERTTEIEFFEYSPEGARRCVQALQNAECGEVDYKNLCTVIWTGTLEVGQSCTDEVQCKGDTVSCIQGTCTEQPVEPGAAEGEACEWGGQCAPGLACISKQCAPALARGAACTYEVANEVCESGSFCHPQNKLCEAQVNEGEDCVFDDQCSTDSCVNYLCSGRDPICTQ